MVFDVGEDTFLVLAVEHIEIGCDLLGGVVDAPVRNWPVTRLCAEPGNHLEDQDQHLDTFGAESFIQLFQDERLYVAFRDQGRFAEDRQDVLVEQ